MATKMISVSLSRNEWMEVSSFLECVSLIVLKSDGVKPEDMERYTKLYHISSTIRLAVLKTCDSNLLLFRELKDIPLDDVLNNSEL